MAKSLSALPALFLFAFAAALPQVAEAGLEGTAYGGTITAFEEGEKIPADVCIRFFNPAETYEYTAQWGMRSVGSRGNDGLVIDFGFVAFWRAQSASGIAFPGKLTFFYLEESVFNPTIRGILFASDCDPD